MSWCDSFRNCSDESDEAYCKKASTSNENPNKCSDDSSNAMMDLAYLQMADAMDMLLATTDLTKRTVPIVMVMT
ncbi:hypothetical protein CDAR_309171 [Caerostris darwini]|uniref:Uncharacterized protein n=1 Tax=Caerostris darwini TaxID=1538125 RepID=A0AAV4P5X6_9ARAC|nr:hypothetical protein CDAR_309171 [Caerostris darwini]